MIDDARFQALTFKLTMLTLLVSVVFVSFLEG